MPSQSVIGLKYGEHCVGDLHAKVANRAEITVAFWG